MVLTQTQIGIGLEVECFIVDSEGKPAQEISIDGELMSTSEWIQQEVQRVFPELRGAISLEQIASHLEMKTLVCENRTIAARQIIATRRKVETILHAKGLHLSFQPVLEDELSLIPATLDPESRTFQLVERWGENAFHSATACFQVNDSRPFAHLLGPGDEMDMRRLEQARIIHNSFTAEKVAELRSTNLNDMRSAQGLTRFEHAQTLLVSQNQERFARFGFPSEQILFPPQFDTIREMLRWMCAFDASSEITPTDFERMSDLSIFRRLNPKEMHSWTVKIKQSEDPRQPWWVESRWGDSLEFSTATELETHLEPATNHFEGFVAASKTSTVRQPDHNSPVCELLQ
ncbi:hypothetical protein HOD30_05295 [Candidatus Peregrinibacteria bacterium]|jgi:hypothetical protein|nr:hypothetical protein [Candidatus Peregrinibacteria bacterium]MBT4631436.1 hypothetical protein [Candidatus Peregrinibacteria bacterium]MBT5823825.1 hypothetical protein [Candidatus Peregrinibacteria bacterium]